MDDPQYRFIVEVDVNADPDPIAKKWISKALIERITDGLEGKPENFYMLGNKDNKLPGIFPTKFQIKEIEMDNDQYRTAATTKSDSDPHKEWYMVVLSWTAKESDEIDQTTTAQWVYATDRYHALTLMKESLKAKQSKIWFEYVIRREDYDRPPPEKKDE